MRNRRVFQRNECNIQVVVHKGGRFLYGEIVDLSLGGVKLELKGSLDAERVELSPKKVLPDDLAIIPLPYDKRWEEGSLDPSVGLQFAGGTDAFFRGWLSKHLNTSNSDFSSLLDHRKLVRIPCQLSGAVSSDEGTSPCSVLDISLGGLSFVSKDELLPGMTVKVSVDEHPELGLAEIILLRVQPLTGHYLCGGKLLDPDSHQAEVMEHLVNELATRPKSATLEE